MSEKQTAQKKRTTTKAVIKVTTRRDGFRRAGREWYGTTEIEPGELTEDQLAALKADPMFAVES